jgi:hypothetical protein
MRSRSLVDRSTAVKRRLYKSLVGFDSFSFMLRLSPRRPTTRVFILRMIFMNDRHSLPTKRLVTIAPPTISALNNRITHHPLGQVRDKLLLLSLSSTPAPVDFVSIFGGSGTLSNHDSGVLLGLHENSFES